MKISYLLPCLCLLSGLTVLTSLEARPRPEARPAPEDHLVPLRTSVVDEYRPSLYQKLLVTSGNYGRMVEYGEEEPDRGEFAVSIQCGAASGAENQCSVTLTKVEKNLGAILMKEREKRPLELISRVRAIRKDAPIAPSTAAAIRSVWTKMLRNVKPRRKDGRIVNDAGRIEFFIGPPSPTGRIAQAPDDYGKTLNAFVELGRLLAKYCESPESARGTMAQQIERDAKALVRRSPLIEKSKKGSG